MRICFTSDLHGATLLYEQLGRLLQDARPDLLILGGDLVRDVDRQQPVWPQVEQMGRAVANRVAEWRAAFRGLAVAVVLGNHELACMVDALRPHAADGHFTLLDHGIPWEHGGLTFVGYPATPPSPHWAKDFERLDRGDDPLPDFPGVAWDATARELREVDLAAHFRGRPSIDRHLGATPPIANPWVLVAHAPPFDSRLDRLPDVPYPIGSRAVRAFIEERQPLLGLHGHIHDSPEVTGCFSDYVGDTLCINPGQAHERLHAVLFDADRPARTLRHTVLA